MSITVCLIANTIGYPEGGGHFWVYLNWALGLKGCGCRVQWLEVLDERLVPKERMALSVRSIERALTASGLPNALAVCQPGGGEIPGAGSDILGLEAVSDAHLVLNMRSGVPADLIARFRRSAFLDTDPGLLQLWMTQHLVSVPPHDVYFTIGETVGAIDARFPEAGLRWHYTPPCVALDSWPVREAQFAAPFTTVCHWYSGEWVTDSQGFYCNQKREGFRPFLDLPARVRDPLELALCLGGDEGEQFDLERRGWHVREAWEVTGSPGDYQRYIQRSRGEFSCAKPSCVRLQNAWISDRTLCYLASGKPAIVQHTGPSRFLPEREGLLRFRDLEEAVRCFETVEEDYGRQCLLARALAEEHFDAKKVARRLLERALA